MTDGAEGLTDLVIGEEMRYRDESRINYITLSMSLNHNEDTKRNEKYLEVCSCNKDGWTEEMKEGLAYT